MLIYICKLLRGKELGGHILVLDAFVGQQGGGIGPAKVHFLIPAEVQLRDGVVAGEQLFRAG